MSTRPQQFASERDLCAAFIAAIGDEWTAYPETEGWDILLVRNEDGFQIGVEAKLRLNAEVLNQARETWHSWGTADRGPDCRAVLVPSGKSGGLSEIAAHLGITVIRCDSPETNSSVIYSQRFRPSLPKISKDHWADEGWHERPHTLRHTLPDYVPDVAAGASGPTKLTRWKVSAIKIAIILEKRGYVVRADFKHVGIDYRRWFDGWLSASGGGAFKPGPHMPDFRRQHPTNFEQIAADYDKWKPVDPEIHIQIEMI